MPRTNEDHLLHVISVQESEERVKEHGKGREAGRHHERVKTSRRARRKLEKAGLLDLVPRMKHARAAERVQREIEY